MGQHGGDPQAAGEEVVFADASIVVKWFADKEHTRDALRAMEDHVDIVIDIASLGVVRTS